MSKHTLTWLFKIYVQICPTHAHRGTWKFRFVGELISTIRKDMFQCHQYRSTTVCTLWGFNVETNTGERGEMQTYPQSLKVQGIILNMSNEWYQRSHPLSFRGPMSPSCVQAGQTSTETILTSCKILMESSQAIQKHTTRGSLWVKESLSWVSFSLYHSQSVR